MVLVRYYAAARAAAGVTEESADAGTLGDVRAELVARRSFDPERTRFTTVLAACSFLVDGRATVDDATVLPAGVTVEVLPPFAGG